MQETNHKKDFFVLNCGSITNIPFYQKIFSKFSIPYNVICDTDDVEILETDSNGNPSFKKGIQKSISGQFNIDKNKENPNTGIFRVHNTTFEPAHQNSDIPKNLRFIETSKLGKPFNANNFWKKILKSNLKDKNIKKVPIIKYLTDIIKDK